MRFFGPPRQVLEQLKVRHERLLSYPYRLVSRRRVTDQPYDMILKYLQWQSDPSYNVGVSRSERGVVKSALRKILIGKK